MGKQCYYEVKHHQNTKSEYIFMTMQWYAKGFNHCKVSRIEFLPSPCETQVWFSTEACISMHFFPTKCMLKHRTVFQYNNIYNKSIILIIANWMGQHEQNYFWIKKVNIIICGEQTKQNCTSSYLYVIATSIVQLLQPNFYIGAIDWEYNHRTGTDIDPIDARINKKRDVVSVFWDRSAHP